MKLTEEQKFALKNVIKFKNNIQTIGGFAGTGKTVLIRNLFELLPNFAFCAYTGKATNVLRKKGIDTAQTIHSLIYSAHEVDGQVYFSPRADLDCDGIVVDEASMVSQEIYKDLSSFNKPIIFVGDHGQLEPVGDKFNLMQDPDFKLEHIHRNAGEIAHFAEFIRNGFRPASWEHRHPCKNIKFVKNYKDYVADVDQVICAFNNTRVQINKLVRKKLGKNENVPEISDKIICLRNNSKEKIFNGMIGWIGWFYNKHVIEFVTEDNFSCKVPLDLKCFNKSRYEFEYEKNSPNPFDYAYAITCHKAQGDEFDNILVVEQSSNSWDHTRWCYTAASRSKKSIIWCC